MVMRELVPLQIEVRSVHALRALPEQLRLVPGASAHLTALSESGSVPEEIEWIMDGPFIASLDAPAKPAAARAAALRMLFEAAKGRVPVIP
jgi:hypothetical protein